MSYLYVSSVLLLLSSYYSGHTVSRVPVWLSQARPVLPGGGPEQDGPMAATLCLSIWDILSLIRLLSMSGWGILSSMFLCLVG